MVLLLVLNVIFVTAACAAYFCLFKTGRGKWPGKLSLWSLFLTVGFDVGYLCGGWKNMALCIGSAVLLMLGEAWADSEAYNAA